MFKELNLFKFVFVSLGATALAVSAYLFTGTGNVDVVYLHDAPPSSEIYMFFLRWTEPLILGTVGGMFFLFGGGIMLAQVLTERRNQYLREQGIAIKTEFLGVEQNQLLMINNRRPYQVVTQWRNPSTSGIHVFRSSYLMFDPTNHIKTKQITVFIERDNPDKYFVDLSFLPKIEV